MIREHWTVYGTMVFKLRKCAVTSLIAADYLSEEDAVSSLLTMRLHQDCSSMNAVIVHEAREGNKWANPKVVYRSEPGAKAWFE